MESCENDCWPTSLPAMGVNKLKIFANLIGEKNGMSILF
jgi:hypothetical protein